MEKDISVENPRENNESEPFLKDASVQNPSGLAVKYVVIAFLKKVSLLILPYTLLKSIS